MRNRPSRKWIFLLSGVIAVRLVSYYPAIVEKYYSLGTYPLTSGLQRWLTGWLPFSFGDLLYILAGIWVLKWLVSGVVAVKDKSFSGRHAISTFILISISIYLIFNLLWGLNYNRISPAKAAGLTVKDTVDPLLLASLTGVFLEKSNRYRPRTIVGFSTSRKDAAGLFSAPSAATVKPVSMKPSLFGQLGNYMGYSGYYNPISGEAQVNTYVPAFLIPFVACHEMAHQAGYAKENEANFVGFMAARRSADSSMLYSAYFNMFLYANAQLRQMDSLQAKQNMKLLSAGVREDLAIYRAYLSKYDSPLGTAVDIFYNQFLKMNQQPAGQMTYNRVVLWLLAYYEKYGAI